MMRPPPFVIALPFLLSALSLDAEAEGFRTIRSEEQWTDTGPGVSAPLKNIRLGSSGSTRLSIGGDIRQRWEGFRNEAWGEAEEAASSSQLQRYMLHFDLRSGSRFRFFGQLKSGIETGRNAGPRVVDEDRLDVHEAWAEWQFVEATETRGIALRLGRQEVNFGSGRLISIREGPNVRLSFDAARVIANAGEWNVQGFAMRPHRTKPGIFDDVPDHRQSLWGAYVTRQTRHFGLDVYYIGLARKTAEFEASAGNEFRHSFGTRVFGLRQPWDYDFEAVWQGGRFGTGSINAWTTASNVGYTWECALTPRAGLKADVASGDKNPNDRTLGTFNALYPKGAYFSQADLLGPYNLVDVHPSISVRPAEPVTVTADVDIFWRHSPKDGLYDVPGFLIVPSHGSRARHVGYGTNVSVEWEVGRNLTVEAEYQRFLPGRFLRDVNLTKTVTYVGVWATFRF